MFIVIIALLIMIKNISSSILSSFNRTRLLEDLQTQLEEKKQDQKYLSQKLEIAKTDQYVEEEARTKLGLIREGEQIIIDSKIVEEKREKEVENIPNWQKWLKILNRS